MMTVFQTNFLLLFFLITLSSIPMLANEGVELELQQKLELSEYDKTLINLRLDRIVEKDQQFRTFLSSGTIDEKKLKQLKNLSVEKMLRAISESENELPNEVREVFAELQRRNDRENHAEFFQLVEKYGYPSKERLGVKADRLFAVLLHPPVDGDKMEQHVQSVRQRLMPEVMAGRMPAKSLAIFVDNMLCKIQGKSQLYGTNKVYDRKSGKILPPIIENLAKTNQARRKIGLKALVEGEYQLAIANVGE